MKKIISITTLLIFISTQTLFAAHPVFSLKVKEEHGKVTQRFKGNSQKTIIHVQDAHSSFEAQKNLANIIEQLVTSDTPELANIQVGIEGASGAVDVMPFKDFPLAQVRREVGEAYVKEGIFTGSELAAVSSEANIELNGIEDAQLFQENFQAFYLVSAKQSELEIEIESLEECLNLLKDATYNEELAKFDDAASSYESNQSQLMSFLGELYKGMQTTEIDQMDFISLVQFKEVFLIERMINYDALDGELKKLSETLIFEYTNQQDAKAEDVTRRFQSYSQKEISRKDFASFVYALGMKENILHDKYQNLKRSITYSRKYGMVDMSALMREIVQASTAVRSRLAQTEQERLLIQVHAKLVNLRQLLSLRALKEDVQAFRSNRSDYSISSIVADLKRAASLQGMNVRLPEITIDMNQMLNNVDTFYQAAEKRDHALLENMIKQMEQNNADVGVLVAGGYHSAGIVDLLKQNQMGYATVMPAISSTAHDVAYMDRMMGSIAPLNTSLISHFNYSRINMILQNAVQDESHRQKLIDIFGERTIGATVTNPQFAAELVLENLQSSDPIKKEFAQTLFARSQTLATKLQSAADIPVDAIVADALEKAGIKAMTKGIVQEVFTPNAITDIDALQVDAPEEIAEERPSFAEDMTADDLRKTVESYLTFYVTEATQPLLDAFMTEKLTDSVVDALLNNDFYRQLLYHELRMARVFLMSGKVTFSDALAVISSSLVRSDGKLSAIRQTPGGLNPSFFLHEEEAKIADADTIDEWPSNYLGAYYLFMEKMLLAQTELTDEARAQIKRQDYYQHLDTFLENVTDYSGDDLSDKLDTFLGIDEEDGFRVTIQDRADYNSFMFTMTALSVFEMTHNSDIKLLNDNQKPVQEVYLDTVRGSYERDIRTIYGALNSLAIDATYAAEIGHHMMRIAPGNDIHELHDRLNMTGYSARKINDAAQINYYTTRAQLYRSFYSTCKKYGVDLSDAMTLDEVMYGMPQELRNELKAVLEHMPLDLQPSIVGKKLVDFYRDAGNSALRTELSDTVQQILKLVDDKLTELELQNAEVKANTSYGTQLFFEDGGFSLSANRIAIPSRKSPYHRLTGNALEVHQAAEVYEFSVRRRIADLLATGELTAEDNVYEFYRLVGLAVAREFSVGETLFTRAQQIEERIVTGGTVYSVRPDAVKDVLDYISTVTPSDIMSIQRTIRNEELAEQVTAITRETIKDLTLRIYLGNENDFSVLADFVKNGVSAAEVTLLHDVLMTLELLLRRDSDEAYALLRDPAFVQTLYTYLGSDEYSGVHATTVKLIVSSFEKEIVEIKDAFAPFINDLTTLSFQVENLLKRIGEVDSAVARDVLIEMFIKNAGPANTEDRIRWVAFNALFEIAKSGDTDAIDFIQSIVLDNAIGNSDIWKEAAVNSLASLLAQDVLYAYGALNEIVKFGVGSAYESELLAIAKNAVASAEANGVIIEVSSQEGLVVVDDGAIEISSEDVEIIEEDETIIEDPNNLFQVMQERGPTMEKNYQKALALLRDLNRKNAAASERVMIEGTELNLVLAIHATLGKPVLQELIDANPDLALAIANGAQPAEFAKDQRTGQYRNVVQDVFRNFSIPVIENVELLTESLLAWLDTQESAIRGINDLQERKQAVARLIAQMHYMVIFIHPVVDGSGRISRLLTNYLADKYGFDVVAGTREAYEDAYAQADALLFADGAKSFSQSSFEDLLQFVSRDGALAPYETFISQSMKEQETQAADPIAESVPLNLGQEQVARTQRPEEPLVSGMSQDLRSRATALAEKQLGKILEEIMQSAMQGLPDGRVDRKIERKSDALNNIMIVLEGKKTAKGDFFPLTKDGTTILKQMIAFLEKPQKTKSTDVTTQSTETEDTRQRISSVEECVEKLKAFENAILLNEEELETIQSVLDLFPFTDINEEFSPIAAATQVTDLFEDKGDFASVYDAFVALDGRFDFAFLMKGIVREKFGKNEKTPLTTQLLRAKKVAELRHQFGQNNSTIREDLLRIKAAHSVVDGYLLSPIYMRYTAPIGKRNVFNNNNIEIISIENFFKYLMEEATVSEWKHLGVVNGIQRGGYFEDLRDAYDADSVAVTTVDGEQVVSVNGDSAMYAEIENAVLRDVQPLRMTTVDDLPETIGDFKVVTDDATRFTDMPDEYAIADYDARTIFINKEKLAQEVSGLSDTERSDELKKVVAHEYTEMVARAKTDDATLSTNDFHTLALFVEEEMAINDIIIRHFPELADNGVVSVAERTYVQELWHVFKSENAAVQNRVTAIRNAVRGVAYVSNKNETDVLARADKARTLFREDNRSLFEDRLQFAFAEFSAIENAYQPFADVMSSWESDTLDVLQNHGIQLNALWSIIEAWMAPTTDKVFRVGVSKGVTDNNELRGAVEMILRNEGIAKKNVQIAFDTGIVDGDQDVLDGKYQLILQMDNEQIQFDQDKSKAFAFQEEKNGKEISIFHSILLILLAKYIESGADAIPSDLFPDFFTYDNGVFMLTDDVIDSIDDQVVEAIKQTVFKMAA